VKWPASIKAAINATPGLRPGNFTSRLPSILRAPEANVFAHSTGDSKPFPAT
jgi:hypothetical protein